jgi:hypothetical protein
MRVVGVLLGAALLAAALPGEAEHHVPQERIQLVEFEQSSTPAADASTRESRRSARQEASARKRCDKLASRAKWAAEQAAKASAKNEHKTSRKAARAAEQYEAECRKPEAQRDVPGGPGR